MAAYQIQSGKYVTPMKCALCANKLVCLYLQSLDKKLSFTLRIWLHLLKKFLMKNIIFYAVSFFYILSIFCISMSSVSILNRSMINVNGTFCVHFVDILRPSNWVPYPCTVLKSDCINAHD